MRVLLDESVPRQLAGHLTGHSVTTVQAIGWSGLRNGELLRRASEAFDVLVTGDQSLEHQQNLDDLSLGIVVVAARDNKVGTFVALAGRILVAIASVRSAGVERVVP